MSVIQQKIEEGTLIRYYDFRSGSFHDFSGNGGVLVPHGGFFSKDGYHFDSTVYLEESSNLGLTDYPFTFVAITRTSKYKTATIMDLADSAVIDINHLIYHNSSGDLVAASRNGGAFANAIDTAGDSDERQFVVGMFEGDASRTAMTDIVSSTENTTTIDFNTDVDTFSIGRQGDSTPGSLFDGIIECSLVFTEIPSVSELAQIKTELYEMVWPTKVSEKTMYDLKMPDLGQTMLLDMKPVGDTIPDLAGGVVATKYGNPVVQKDMLGNALMFNNNSDDYIDVTSADAINVGTGDFTIAVWYKRTDTGSTNTTPLSKRTNYYGSGGIGYNLFLGKKFRGGCGDGTTTVGENKELFSADLDENLWHLLIAEFDRDGNMTGYIDDITGETTDISAVTGTLTNATNMKLGKGTVSATYQPAIGDMAHPMIFKKLLTVAEKTALYRVGAELVQYKTDWGIAESSGNRTSSFLENSDWVIDSGTWRVSNDIIDGEPVKVIECIYAGMVYLPIELFMNDAEGAYGTWDWWMNKGGATNYLHVGFIADIVGKPNTAGQDGYAIQLDSGERMNLLRSDNGAVTQLASSAVATLPINTWGHIKITRDVTGEFTVYFNDELLTVTSGSNPVTDTTHITSKYVVLDLDAGDKIAIGDRSGNHAFNKHLGTI